MIRITLALVLASLVSAAAVAQDSVSKDTRAVGQSTSNKPDATARKPVQGKGDHPQGRQEHPGPDSKRPLEPIGVTKPANAAVGDHPVGAPAPTQLPAPINFDPPILNLGEMQADVPKTGKIKLVNSGSEPVRILKAIPGCGCTTAGWPKDPIPAGESAEVEITLKPGAKQGVHLSKKVTFQVEGYQPLLLSVEGDVKAYIKLSQDIIDAPTPEKPNDGRVTLTSADGTPFKVTASNPAVLKALPEEAKTEHVLEIDWEKWEQLGRGIKVAFTTDHPKSPSLSVIVKRSIKSPGPTPPEGAATANPSRAQSAFVTAARLGDATRVKLEVGNGADVNQVDGASGRTALHWAAKENRMEIVPMLLEAKANLEAADRTGKTPLALAAESGNADATRMLLEAGASPNARDQIGGSPLLWACGLGTPETVQLLLDKGADISVVDVNGLTPLLWAAGIGSPETVGILLARKPDLAIADNVTGDTALMRAVRSGKVESVKLLIGAGADVNAVNRQGLSPVLVAAANGSPDKVALLIEAKADLNAKNLQGMDVLEIAGRRSDASGPQVLQMLEAATGRTRQAPPSGG